LAPQRQDAGLAYSTNGRTNALYAFCFTVVEPMFRLRFRNPIVLFALLQMLRAARYVTNSHNNRSRVNQMLEHLEWKSLEQRRKDTRLTMMYKITNEKVAIPKEGRSDSSICFIADVVDMVVPSVI
jgi:hypothetical protein